MAAPTKPESPGQGQSQSQTTQQTNQPAAQPTSQPPAGQNIIPQSLPSQQTGVPVEELARRDRLIQQQEAAMRDMHRQNQELLKKVNERLDEERQTQSTPSRDDRDKKFWNSPSSSLDEFENRVLGLIKTELDRTVKPLNDKLGAIATRSAYDGMKDRVRGSMPAETWSRIEPYVDQFVQSAAAQGMEVNDQLLDVAVTSTVGAMALGRLGTATEVRQVASQQSPTQSAGNGGMVTPPHLRPSAPAAPSREPEAAPLRDLTENEERLRRERNWTREQYLSWLDVPAEKVIHSQIGREKK